MARRKKTIIDLKKLDIYPKLIDELKSNPAFANKDLKTLSLSVLENYEATIVDIDKAIKNLKYYLVANKNKIKIFEGEQFISRRQVAQMLGITRQTLTTWIDKNFITTIKSRYTKEETFNTNTLLKELEEYKLRTTTK